MRLIFSDQAKDDITNISNYITQQSKNRNIGKTFAKRIIDHCKELASINGTIGTERPELRPGLRSQPFGNYVIFFMYRDDNFVVTTIIEGHRDIKTVFDTYTS